MSNNIFSYLIIIALVFMVAWYFYFRKGKQGGTSILSQYSTDLTDLAKQNKLDPVVGRVDEISRAIQVLCRRTKSNPVLVGNAGVGKTAIVEGLAQRIVEEKVPDNLLGKRVLALDLGSLVSGTKYRGEFEERLKIITREIEQAQRNIIIFIDELHVLAETGEAVGAIGAGDILKPMLARGDLQMVGASTFKEYFKTIKSDPTLERRFQPIYVKEPNSEETLKIITGLKEKYENFHQVKITNEALKEAVDLAGRYIKDRNFPDKAIDLIDEACSHVKLEKVDKKKKGVLKVTAKAVQEVLKARFNIQKVKEKV